MRWRAVRKGGNITGGAGSPTAGASSWDVPCDVIANSLSSYDVQTAITNAPEGGTVCLPAGSETWTEFVSNAYSAGSPTLGAWDTTKWVKIQGAGTMPVVGAATSRGTTIIDNVPAGASSVMLMLREAAAGNITLANITVTLTDGYSKFSVIGWEPGPVATGTAGAKVPVMHHMTFNDSRTSSTSLRQVIRASAARGVIYRNKFLLADSGEASNGFAVFRCGTSNHAFWESVNTFGTADSGGDLNFYFEDNIATGYSETSTDAACRTVYRFNELTNLALGGHGRDSQSPGSRQMEAYGNNFNCVSRTEKMGSPISLRGASQRLHNNRFDTFDTNCTNVANAGHVVTGVYVIRDRVGTGCFLDSGGNYLTYPAYQQFGWGYTTGATTINRYGYDEPAPSTHIVADADNPYNQDLEPSYLWNNFLKNGTTKIYDGTGNTGGLALIDFASDTCGSGQSSSDFIVENREWYKQNDTFDGTTGVGIGARASRPATCTTGTAWWASDQGSAMTSTTTGLTVQGVLDICTGTNTWTNGSYQMSYPHSLATVTGS